VPTPLMALCDGWRVLTQAVPVLRLNASDVTQQDMRAVLQLAQFAV
jgi:hypothetical protein